MEETKFKIGDIVKLKESSEYYRQAPNLTGIFQSFTSDRNYKYQISFTNGNSNQYRNEDLELVIEDKLKKEINSLKELILSNKHSIELNKEEREIFYKILDKLDIIISPGNIESAKRYDILYSSYSKVNQVGFWNNDRDLILVKFKDIQDRFRKLRDEKV